MKKMKQPMWTCGGVKLEFMLFLMLDLCCGTFIY